MDFKTFSYISTNVLPSDVSVIVRGRHGIGKSELIKQIASTIGLPVLDRRLSQLTEGDLLGLPFAEGSRSTKFLPPDWFADAMDLPFLIFLDEFDRSSKTVQQAAMELVLDRSIQGKKIHSGCRIFAAINGGKYGTNYNVNAIDPALNDRFFIVDVDPSAEEWLEWGKKDQNILPIIRDFISKNQEHLENKFEIKDANEIQPSRRSWKRLSDTFKRSLYLLEDPEKHDDVFVGLCFGFVGKPATSKFRDYVIKHGKQITAQDILNSFEEYKNKEFEIAELNFLIGKIAETLEEEKNPDFSNEQVDNAIKFFHILPAELMLSFYDKMTSVEISTRRQETSIKFVNGIGDKLRELVGNE